jgi:hypothetical protein
MASNIAQAIFRWDGKLECSFPYSKYLVEQLKAHIPASHREWVPEHKVWIVDSVYATTALRLMRDTFGDVRLDDQRFEYQEPSPPPRTPRVDLDFATLYILPDAPLCVIDAAYRALSKQCHPDRVPAPERATAHEKMIALTNAYDAVRDRIAS